jgi:hypothetical protein
VALERLLRSEQAGLLSERHDDFALDVLRGRMRWGLIPSCAKDPAIGNRMINVQLSDISNVSFQYGTSLVTPDINIIGVPEPNSITLALAGIAGLGLLGRKRR